MSACHKCWDDAFIVSRITPESQVEAYHRLVRERNERGEVCTIAEQAAMDLTEHQMRLAGYDSNHGVVT